MCSEPPPASLSYVEAIGGGLATPGLSSELDARRLQAAAERFLATGLATEAVLGWLWRRAGIIQADSSPELPGQLIQLLRQLAIALEWHPTADGQPQWLLPLRLPGPADAPALPDEWSEEAAASAVCRVYDFGGDVPSGLVGALINDCATQLVNTTHRRLPVAHAVAPGWRWIRADSWGIVSRFSVRGQWRGGRRRRADLLARRPDCAPVVGHGPVPSAVGGGWPDQRAVRSPKHAAERAPGGLLST